MQPRYLFTYYSNIHTHRQTRTEVERKREREGQLIFVAQGMTIATSKNVVSEKNR